MSKERLGDTDTRVKEVAVRLFGTKGFAATGIRDIARESGITTASLYHYMATKEELLMRLMVEAMDLLLGRVEGAESAYPDSISRLRFLVAAHVEFHCTSAPWARVTDTELRSLDEESLARVLALRDRYESIWRKTLTEGQENGVFDIENVGIVNRAVLGLCTSVYNWYSPDGPLTIAQIAQHYQDLVLRLCGVVASQSSSRRNSQQLEV